MAIAEMSRLTLVGLICDRDNILEAVQRTGAVQIIGAEEREMEQAAKVNPSETELAAAISRAENALDVLTREIEAAPKSSGAPKPAVVKDGIGVTADEFFAVGKSLARYEKIIEDIERIASERAGNKSRENALIAERGNYEDYGCLSESFAAFRDTAAASVYLGIVPFEKTAALEGAIGAISTAWCRIEGAARRGNVAVAVCLSADKEETEKALAESGFAKYLRKSRLGFRLQHFGDPRGDGVITRSLGRSHALSHDRGYGDGSLIHLGCTQCASTAFLQIINAARAL